MARNRNAETLADHPPAEVEVEIVAAEVIAAPEPAGPIVYQIEIPNCLLKRRFVLADSPEEALAKYKAPCGITTHDQKAVIAATDLSPTAVELWG